MTLAALDALIADPDTELIVVIGKPAAPAVRPRGGGPAPLRRQAGRPRPARRARGNATRRTPHRVATLEDAADAAAAEHAGRAWTPRPFTLPREEIRDRVDAARRARHPSQVAVRGLFAGGTLAHEAALILGPLLGPIGANLTVGSAETRAHASGRVDGSRRRRVHDRPRPPDAGPDGAERGDRARGQGSETWPSCSSTWCSAYGAAARSSRRPGARAPDGAAPRPAGTSARSRWSRA